MSDWLESHDLGSQRAGALQSSTGESAMPLRDHFRPPVEQRHSWDELHGGWPMIIVQTVSIELDLEPSYEETCRYLRIS